MSGRCAPPSAADALRAELAAIDALPLYLEIPEVAAVLRVCVRTVNNLLNRGELERRRLGGRTLVPRESIRAWVLRQAALNGDSGGRPRR
jgi:excisionase family DNA binding protein